MTGAENTTRPRLLTEDEVRAQVREHVIQAIRLVKNGWGAGGRMEDIVALVVSQQSAVSAVASQNTTREKIAWILWNAIEMETIEPEDLAFGENWFLSGSSATDAPGDDRDKWLALADTVIALIAAFPTLTATPDPDDEQAWIEYMSTDDFLQLIPTPGSMFRAGYRAALAAVPGGNA